VHVKAIPDQVPAGWALGKSADGAVRIGVPSGWRVGVDKMSSPLDLGGSQNSQPPDPQLQNSQLGQDLQKMAADMDRRSDQMEQKELKSLADHGILINVITMGSRPTPGEARTRFYVKRKGLGHPASLLEAAEMERGEFEHKPTPLNVVLPIGPALKMSETRTLRDGGEFHQTSYLVVDGEDVYAIRFITEESPGIVDSISDQVVRSLRISPSRA